MKLNIKKLLDFFDDKEDSQKGDANAFMAMFGEDLNASAYEHFRKNKVTILNSSVLTGTGKGKMLDRWILDNGKLYQCEIKNWAAGAIGGKRLKSIPSDDKRKEVVKYYWERELKDNFSSKTKHPTGVSKVLLEMKPPGDYKKFKIEPLLIYWMPISSDKKGLNPLSVLSIKPLKLKIETKFSKIHIFSVSLYLRQLYKKSRGQKIIDLYMPHFEHRMKILRAFQKK